MLSEVAHRWGVPLPWVKRHAPLRDVREEWAIQQKRWEARAYLEKEAEWKARHGR